MKILVNLFKKLPKNLIALNLDLKLNNLGENPENLFWLKEGLKQLPNNLLKLKIDLSENYL